MHYGLNGHSVFTIQGVTEFIKNLVIKFTRKITPH
jgi:hypothetical protein